MSATPEEIAIDEKALAKAKSVAPFAWTGFHDEHFRAVLGAYLSATKDAQAEKVRVLEETAAYMYAALCGARHAIDLLMCDTDPNEDTPATLAMQAIQKAIERADLLTATGAPE